MADLLQPCVACSQHIRVDERACPFCNAELPENFGDDARARVSRTRPMSRAAILFVGATAAAACGGSTETGTGSSGDASTHEDGSAADGSGIDGAVVLYGPAPFDASVDHSVDASPDGPVAAYGPGPVDSGDAG
jgi:hypothetical protein